MTEIVMVVGALPDVPRRDLPAGLSLRMYREGDEDLWVDIHHSTGTYGSVSDALYEREFGAHRDALPERQFYVVEASGNAVATATAWFPHEPLQASLGRVHWVAVRPDHQRLGIGAALVSILCETFARLGATSAYLTTGSENLPAISLYLQAGFLPIAHTAEARALWHTIAPRLPGRHRDAVLATI